MYIAASEPHSCEDRQIIAKALHSPFPEKLRLQSRFHYTADIVHLAAKAFPRIVWQNWKPDI